MRTIQYYCKMALLGIWSLTVSIIFYFLSFPFYQRKWLSWAYARALNAGTHRALGIKVEVTGRENMVSGPAVILMNHQSNFDPLLQGPVFPKNTVVIGKKNLLKIPLWGRLLRATNNILVDRSAKHQGAIIVGAAVERLQNDDCYVWIFPEGTRSHGKGLGAFKKGAFSMAINAEVPIIPMVSAPILPLLDTRAKVAKGGVFRIDILPVINTDEIAGENAVSLMHKCETLYQNHLAKYDRPESGSNTGN
ncbi:MAG: 1-acyl-sn-glycerol-3-phosphate acyltransferase [Acidiferrobacterales bacterium]|nr:1-acyl-sn-glycerol-3-phosphate acyltransferase [Acidiferrobacterales bacterium]